MLLRTVEPKILFPFPPDHIALLEVHLVRPEVRSQSHNLFHLVKIQGHQDKIDHYLGYLRRLWGGGRSQARDIRQVLTYPGKIGTASNLMVDTGGGPVNGKTDPVEPRIHGPVSQILSQEEPVRQEAHLAPGGLCLFNPSQKPGLQQRLASA